MTPPTETAAPPLRLRLLDAPVTVTVPDPVVHLAATRVLSGFVSPVGAVGADDAAHVPYTLARNEDGYWSVSRPGAGFVANGDLTDGLLALEWQLVMDVLSRCTDLFHLHGAALVAPDGRTGVLVVGESGSGKTTLVLALLRGGYLPYSDDVALMAPDTLALRPFPRAFHIRQPSRPLLEALGMAAREFEDAPPGFYIPPRWATTTAPVRVVLFPTLRPDAPPRIEPLAPSASAALLLAQTASLAGASRLALAATARLTAQARCVRLFSGDLAATVALVDALVHDAAGGETAP